MPPAKYKIVFQSTLLMRGATSATVIYAHSLSDFNPRSSCEEHARSDSLRPSRWLRMCHFNPRSSCEERQHTSLCHVPRNHFNPRSSCEERRPRLSTLRGDKPFQSTLLMRGATSMRAWAREPSRHFNPRSSCEERRCPARLRGDAQISIHAPHARSDSERAGL